MVKKIERPGRGPEMQRKGVFGLQVRIWKILGIHLLGSRTVSYVQEKGQHATQPFARK